ncbi:hypothetical protein [Nocardia gamkensis]|uniref:hypothetical protein n=1 Tax=Nocardia gamkensis TaxID=352869 RepID=UPI0037C56C2E
MHSPSGTWGARRLSHLTRMRATGRLELLDRARSTGGGESPRRGSSGRRPVCPENRRQPPAKGVTINGRMLGHGDPLRVREGERVLLHVLNGSATENRSLALPGHTFTVMATDGNPVPNPARVPVLWLGTAERISASVEMTNPGCLGAG